MKDHPMTLLLEKPRPLGGCWMALAVGLLALFSGTSEGCLFVLLVVAPALWGLQEALSDSTRLRALGGFEELRQTPLTPTEVVDGVATFSLRRMGRAVWRPVLFAGVVTLADPATGPWLLGCQAIAVLLVGAVSYLAQLTTIQAVQGAGAGWEQVLHLPGAALLGAAFIVPARVWPAELSVAAFAFLLAAGLVAVAASCRFHAARTLERNQSRPSLTPARPARRSRPWSDNPIVVREVQRASGSSAGVAVVVAALGLACLVAPHPLLPLLLLVLLQPFRAAGRTGGAVLDEKEARTFDTLLLTNLSPAEFVDGWAQVGWRPRVLEALLVAPIAGLAAAQRSGPVLLAALALVALAVAACVCASYLGVAASALSENRGKLLGSLLVSAIVMGVLGLSLASLLAPLLGVAAWFVPALVAAALTPPVRRLALAAHAR